MHKELLNEVQLLGARVLLERLDKQRAELLVSFPELGKTEAGRRRHDEAFKARVVGKLAAGGYLADVAREVGVVPSLVAKWAAVAGVRVRKMPARERARRRARV